MDLGFSINLDSQVGNHTKQALKGDLVHDILILGAGPAGLTAAIYAKRKGLKVGVIADKIGGQVLDTSSVENYPGFESITGENLAKQFQDHANSLEIPMKNGLRIKSIIDGSVKKVELTDGTVFQSKVLLLATGSRPRTLGVTGEDTFFGKGVTYCGICDGPLFAGLTISIAGGGNSAVEAAIDMAKIAKKVILVHRSKLRADKILIDKLKSFENIEVHLETIIQEINGNKQVERLLVKDKTTDIFREIETNGLIVEIGSTPNSDAFKEVVEMTNRGEIIIDVKGRTNKAGIFAAGDVTTVPYKQIVIASSEGAKATLAANDYLNSL